jgi:hypothetical protein
MAIESPTFGDSFEVIVRVEFEKFWTSATSLINPVNIPIS